MEIRKFIKISTVILALLLVFSSCKSIENITASIPITYYEKTDLENIEKIKERKVEEELKKEFFALFKEFSGFEFEKTFFIPEKSKYSDWEVTEMEFLLYSSYIISQTEAEELLKNLRKNNYFRAYYDHSDMIDYRNENLAAFVGSFLDTGRENRQNCFSFDRTGVYIDTYVSRSVYLDIMQIDDSNNTYSVYFYTSIGRNPPSGKSWPRPLSNQPALTFLNRSGEPIDPSNINWDDYSDVPIYYPSNWLGQSRDEEVEVKGNK